MRIMTRSEARALGLPRFFNGIPCKRGHVAERATSNGACHICNHESKMRYVERNREAHYERNKKWQAKNPDRLKANNAAWRERNKARHKKLKDAWRANNPDMARAQSHRRRARKVAASGSYTPNDIADLLVAQDGRCNLCNITLKPNYHIDHIVPLVHGGSNWPTNLQLLCPACNLRKGAKMPTNGDMQ